MATSRSARQGEPPPGFASIQDIVHGKYPLESRVNIAGIVTDFRAPIATKGSGTDLLFSCSAGQILLGKCILTVVDWKCQMQIYDRSVHDEPDVAVFFNIFRPEKEMPDVRCGDVVIVFAAKVSNGLPNNLDDMY